MATLLSESDSDVSDESFETVQYGYVEGLAPYQFEPRRTADLDSDHSDHENCSNDSESEVEGETESRAGGGDRTTMADVHSWCVCGKCSTAHLTGAKEYTCCHEHGPVRMHAAPSTSGTDTSICITNNDEFRMLCLTQTVLRNVLICLNNVKADHWQVNPPSNRSLRYAAYRQFTWWIHGKIGPNRRRVIPACASHAIRSSFPSQNNQYEGFHDNSEDEEDSYMY